MSEYSGGIKEGRFPNRPSSKPAVCKPPLLEAEG
jgi:hypothetical protein